jgi:hypothetical protein
VSLENIGECGRSLFHLRSIIMIGSILDHLFNNRHCLLFIALLVYIFMPRLTD